MHDAIPSRILNGWLRLEEDLFHLQVLSYLPPQIPSYPPQYTTLFPCGKDTAHKRPLRQLSALRLIHFNNYVPGGISCAADLTAIFRHKISVSGAPSGKRLLSASAHSPGCFVLNVVALLGRTGVDVIALAIPKGTGAADC